GYGEKVLVEERIAGRELAVTVLDSLSEGEPPIALPIVELHTPSGFYSYEAHYTIGGVRLQVPADLPEKLTRRVQDVALSSYALLRCRDFARVDIILDGEGVPYVLEINTIPGLTETGITPAAAEAAGMGFTELVSRIVARATASAGRSPGRSS
ncbi:MAG: D-alanine--D-alanine ligase family protein, partial [Solirubrobacteraceae bacterium]